MNKERFIIGTAENVEAEYGVISLVAGQFVVYEMYDGEGVSIESFPTLGAARESLADVPANLIEWML